MLDWQRRGVLVTPRGDDAWSTHAQAPTVVPLTDELWRVYFAGRDRANRGAIFAVDVEPEHGMRVVRVHDRPFLTPGRSGGFDEDGVGPACALRDGARIVLYYVGISSAPGMPNRHAIGMAISDDGLAFERLQGEAIFSPGEGDPYSTSIPYVGRAAAGFEMWYHSTTGWYDEAGRREATYTIRHAVSSDGIRWARTAGTALRGEDATAQSTRPWVAAGRIWFSRRGLAFRNGAPGAYRIVCAPLDVRGRCATVRAEPINFANPPEPGDWDGEMQAYASIAQARDRLVLFYNGNGFGAKGFGWAEAALS